MAASTGEPRVGCMAHWLRHSIVVIVSVVLGAATTLAIAWQIARKAPAFDRTQVPVRWSHPQGAAWLYRRDESFGAMRLRGEFASASAAGDRMVIATEPLPPWSAMSLARPLPGRPAVTSNWEEAFGWPWPAMMATLHDRGVFVGIPLRIEHAIDLGPHPRDWGMRLYLPTRIIWRGGLLNTAMFAALWWLVIVLVLTMLLRGPRWLRRRRGRCPNCGYDLRGKLDDGCSECGWKRAPNAMSST